MPLGPVKGGFTASKEAKEAEKELNSMKDDIMYSFIKNKVKENKTLDDKETLFYNRALELELIVSTGFIYNTRED